MTIENLLLDSNVSRPFPHFWENIFGSCHAPVTLNESWRNDARLLHELLGRKYIRFHGIFDRDVGLLDRVTNEGLVLNFTRLDMIYDGLLEIGLRPFVELSFTPPELAQEPKVLHPFWYHQCVSAPRSYSQWYEFIIRFLAHLVERYGVNEVGEWFFEVWNEPNIDFWAGEPKFETYCELYKATARAVKEVDFRLRVGGPATAAAEWVEPFIAFCVKNEVPVDFISTHCYPNDPYKMLGFPEPPRLKETVYLVSKRVRLQVENSRMPELPIFLTEYNAGFGEKHGLDGPYVGAWLANNIRLCDGILNEMAYWTFTDAMFEEGGPFRSPFQGSNFLNRDKGGFGLIATHNIPKAGFNAFRLLHRLGDQRIPFGSENAILTKSSETQNLILALWNYCDLGAEGEEKRFRIQLVEPELYRREVSFQVVDEIHGNAANCWSQMGSPQFPTREQISKLQTAARVPKHVTASLDDVISLNPNALALIEIIHR
ncbi:MAG: glycosyl hydrolase family 39 [Verrucomicrobia bacterium]|nr:glycosyl hydrolase family 39 [Verrucomicrobiota bacterium]